MQSSFREGSFYRRGLVLGLTMAEIMILVIFILLLALSFTLDHKEQAIEELEMAVMKRDNELEKLQEWVDGVEKVLASEHEIGNVLGPECFITLPRPGVVVRPVCVQGSGRAPPSREGALVSYTEVHCTFPSSAGRYCHS